VRVCVYSTKPYDREYLARAAVDGRQQRRPRTGGGGRYTRGACARYSPLAVAEHTLAMTSIASTTIANLDDIEAGRVCTNEVTVP
jgi:hypothetical protein